MTDWSDSNNIRAEWPSEDLGAQSDLAAWHTGKNLYNARDDYHGLIEAGGLLAKGLRHELYEAGILPGREVMETTHSVVFAGTATPSDGKTFTPEARKLVRLGLTVAKKYGWQATEHGGTGEMSEYLSSVTMLATVAIAPSLESSFGGDLTAFFRTPFEPVKEHPLAASDIDSSVSNSIDMMYKVVEEADSGDGAAQKLREGYAAGMAGDDAAAMRLFEEAAHLGSEHAMLQAGLMANTLGDPGASKFWLKRAAELGNYKAMFNLGILVFNSGWLSDAVDLMEKSAAGDNPEACAWLAQNSADHDDHESEFRWSERGSELGNPFCMMRLGQILSQRHAKEPMVLLGEVIPMLKRARDGAGNNATFLVGLTYGIAGRRQEAGNWLRLAESEGHPDASRVIREQEL